MATQKNQSAELESKSASVDSSESLLILKRGRPMPPRKTKSPSKPVTGLSRHPKASAKTAKTVERAPARRQPSVRKPAAAKLDTLRPLDISAFPAESMSIVEKRICLACVLDIFTRHLGLSARTAYLEIKKYVPPLAELYAAATTRPWFTHPLNQSICPYCGSPAKWHTTLKVYRIEGGKTTDTLRRQLVKSLPQSDNQFAVIEEKATQQHAFVEWLDKISTGLDLDDPAWLRQVSLHYLGRREPQNDWEVQFGQIHIIRRSRRLENGWEIDHGRLFLAPTTFDELLLVQYLVSRSHRAGGLTLEGRYTLPELFTRLRKSGYLRATGITAQTPDEALEQLVTHLGGGEAGLKFYHVLDRRDFLARVQSLKLVKPPKPKAPFGST